MSENKKLTEKEVHQTFKQAQWDLYLANMPKPVIIDAEKKPKNLPKEFQEHLPRGFFIDSRTWTTYFNNRDVPQDLEYDKSLDKYVKQIEKDLAKQLDNRARLYARSIFQHENTHYTQLPGDTVTEAVLVDAALKGIKDENIKRNKKTAKDYAFLTMNIMGDIIGDTLLAREKYGRENFDDLTIWRTKQTIKQARKTKQDPSPIWQALVMTYQKMWKTELGIEKYVQTPDKEAEKAATNMVKILGNNWKNRITWEEKMTKFAEILEPLIKKSSQQASQQKQMSNQGNNQKKEGEINLPDDITEQLGEPTKSKTGNGNGEKISSDTDLTGIDERVLEEIYNRNKNSPESFAGVFSVLKGIEPEDALRLMYRARAKELLISIEEKKNTKAERSPAYYTGWNIGDPVIGKGGLEIMPSIMKSGKAIPGITTYKRKMEQTEGHGRLKMVPDLLIVIDSSGSMDWYPWKNPPDSRGSFDKAILAAEASALYAINNGGRVAIINFSGIDSSFHKHQYRLQDFTNNIDDLEKTMMLYYRGGTVVPIEQTKNIITGTKNPLLTCLMSDCDISNWQEASNMFSKSISEYDTMAVFKIESSKEAFAKDMEQKGAIIYQVNRIQDLFGLIIGEVKQKYKN